MSMALTASFYFYFHGFVETPTNCLLLRPSFIQKSKTKMNQLWRNNVQFSLRRNIQRHISIIRGCLLHLWNQIRMCSLRNPIRYSMLSHPTVTNSPYMEPNASPSMAASEDGFASGSATPMFQNHHDNDSDLVALKISLLGDCQIGKTSFLAKYVGNEKDEGRTQKNGLNLMDKTLKVKGARISYSIWEVQGDEGSQQQIPMACKDSIAILIMFDLTSRVTLNGVIKWYKEARKWNQTAIPIIVGTKFDDFIQLPIDLQWTIASQARAYAKALNATLFFSSATYNINVNKIFKFVTAKFFDLPWAPERNLTIGEPIIDF